MSKINITSFITNIFMLNNFFLENQYFLKKLQKIVLGRANLEKPK